jgi:putative ABC transport system substrate-binding protein
MKDTFVALIVALFLGILFEPLAVEAQEKGRVYRVGFLGNTNPTLLAPFLSAFRQGLRELGWIEGTRAAQQATSTIPIVAATFTDPIALGVAASLARPGGNVTGTRDRPRPASLRDP